jgi:hypothetical protein
LTRSSKFWRKFAEPAFASVFGPMGRFLDKRRRKNSFQRPVICGHGRDALKYYENGHYVVVGAELQFGDLDRLVFPNQPLKWDDTGELLGKTEAERVMRSFCAELDRNKIRWKFGSGV